MTPIEALLISIDLLREAHKRLHMAGEVSLAIGVADALYAAHKRLADLRKDQ